MGRAARYKLYRPSPRDGQPLLKLNDTVQQIDNYLGKGEVLLNAVQQGTTDPILGRPPARRYNFSANFTVTEDIPNDRYNIDVNAGGVVLLHKILSTTHTDSLPDTVVRGDLIRGNATPLWARLPIVGGGAFTQGTYVGDGTSSKAITGLGFTPKVVIVKGDTAANGHAIVLSSTMVTSKNVTNSTTDNVITSLDPDGFTVNNFASINGRTNENGKTYYWYALGGPAIKTGTYVGNGAASHAITGIGFGPVMAWTIDRVGTKIIFRTTPMGANDFDFGVDLGNANRILTLDADGFTVGSDDDANANGTTYDYVAFAASSNLALGTYVGNGIDNRDLPSPVLSFNPLLVHIKAAAGQFADFRVSAEGTGDTTLTYASFAAAAGKIKSLTATTGQFRLGTDTEVNSPIALTYFFFAFNVGSGAGRTYLSSDGVDPSWRTIALTDITPRAHSSLMGLIAPADDHPQYLLLAGRAGGQTAIGGTGVTDTLTIQGNSSGPGAGNVILQGGSAPANVLSRIQLNSPLKAFTGGAELLYDSTNVAILGLTGSGQILYVTNNADLAINKRIVFAGGPGESAPSMAILDAIQGTFGTVPNIRPVIGSPNVVQFLQGGIRLDVSPNNVIQDSGGTARVTLSTAAPQVTINPAGVVAQIRLNDAIGIGIAPLASAVLRVGIPAGMTVVNQASFSGAKVATIANTTFNIFAMTTSMDAGGFTGHSLRNIVILSTPIGAGSFSEVNVFRINNAINATVTLWNAFAFPHDSMGINAALTTMALFDIGDIDSSLSVQGAGAATRGYAFRVGNRGGLDSQQFGQGTMTAGGIACPILQEQTTAAMVALAGTGNFYNVLAGSTVFGANQAPTAFVDMAASIAASASARIRAGVAPTTPNEGDLWNDSTQKSLIAFVDGVKQADTRTLFVSTADATVTNTVTETTLVGTGIGTVTLPANFLVPGKKLRLEAKGYYDTKAATPGTLQIRVRLGGIAGTLILDTAAQTLPSNVTGNNLWFVRADLICRTTGVTGTIMGQGVFEHLEALVVVGNEILWTMTNIAATTVDTTAAKDVTLSAQFGTADPANKIVCTNFSLEVLD